MICEIAKNIGVYQDTCNVYVIKSGDRGLLIDTGSGSILDALPQWGINRVDNVLLTHSHYDQCFGISRMLDYGADVKAIAAERLYYSDMENREYWNRHYPLETSMTSYFVPSRGDDRVNCVLEPGSSFGWEGIQIDVISAAGHTKDQLAYVVHHESGNILFCGDALYGGGKVWMGYALDWDHWTSVGIDAACTTLERFQGLNLSMLAPSHGVVIEHNIADELESTLINLNEYSKLKSFEQYCGDKGFGRFSARVPYEYFYMADGVKAQKISEHLWVQDNSYFLISDNKECLMVDCGYPYMRHFLPKFSDMAGLEKISAAIVSHAHSDHTEGMSFLQKEMGTKVWALDRLKEILESPGKYWHPWSRWDSFKVDREFADGEKVKWNEYEMVFHWYPGQTAFTCAVETVVDGSKVLFSADNFFPVEQWHGTGGVMGLNRGLPDGYLHSAGKTLQIRPQWILPGHEFPFKFDSAEFEARERWAEELIRSMERLSPDGDWQTHFNPHASTIHPFMQSAFPNETVTVTLQGILSEETAGSLYWDLPDGFGIRQIPTEEKFEIHIPGGIRPGNYPLYAINMQEQGSMAFCIITTK